MTIDPQALLTGWDLGRPQAELVARRENIVYRVITDRGERFALRVRAAGHRSNAEVDAELDWIAMLARGGLRVPEPLVALDGTRTVRADGCRADLVTWLDGVPLGVSGVPLALADARATFAALGRTMAQLHVLSDEWTPPPGFERPAWNVDALVGEAPLWGRFWDIDGLTVEDAALFVRLRDAARVEIGRIAASVDSGLDHGLDQGLIHADLVRENVLVDTDDPAELSIIDFDDGGTGFRLFEIATALGKNVAEPDYDGLRVALLSGYREVRAIDTGPLNLFMALRAATYVGWNARRPSEARDPAREARAIAAARLAAQAWLEGPDDAARSVA